MTSSAYGCWAGPAEAVTSSLAGDVMSLPAGGCKVTSRARQEVTQRAVTSPAGRQPLWGFYRVHGGLGWLCPVGPLYGPTGGARDPHVESIGDLGPIGIPVSIPRSSRPYTVYGECRPHGDPCGDL